MKTKATAVEIAVLGKRYNLNPHPDGKPWVKCCEDQYDTETNCQCFMRKPKIGLSRHDRALNPDGTSLCYFADLLKSEKGRFFCVHRKDGEYHRECAGWAAKITGNKP